MQKVAVGRSREVNTSRLTTSHQTLNDMATNNAPVESTGSNTSGSKRRPGQKNFGCNKNILLRDHVQQSTQLVTSSEHRRRPSYANETQNGMPTGQPSEVSKGSPAVNVQRSS